MESSVPASDIAARLAGARTSLDAAALEPAMRDGLVRRLDAILRSKTLDKIVLDETAAAIADVAEHVAGDQAERARRLKQERARVRVIVTGILGYVTMTPQKDPEKIIVRNDKGKKLKPLPAFEVERVSVLRHPLPPASLPRKKSTKGAGEE